MKKLEEMVGKVEALRARSNANPESKATKSKAPAKPTLPVWVDAARGVPNVALRSALFGATKKGSRGYLERVEIHAQEGITIRYTGARLDQGDLSVWETVLHHSRSQALGDECRATAYRLLYMLGKTDTGKNRDTLDRHLSRLKATALDVRVGQRAYEGSLIDEVYRDEETREYVIRLNPKLAGLFAADQYTAIAWEIRRQLDGQPLAQWLHGYYSSHASPYPIKVDTLHRICGSEATLMSDYAKTLRKALDSVQLASKAHGHNFAWSIVGDLVHVSTSGSKAQRRHLAKRSKPKA